VKALSAIKIISVAGARPNFVKIAPIMRALAAARERRPATRIESLLVDTGQHYDDAMAAALFRDLEIPPPDYALRVGSGSHAQQTAAVLSAFESVLIDERPDVVVVVGDVNSTLAGALAAAKLGIRVAHVEAGLRSFDRRMPEEINRRLTDTLADFLFTTEDDANENLQREGVPADKIFFVGNVMVDSLRWAQRSARSSTILEHLGLHTDAREEGFALVTLHRPSNVDCRQTLAGLLDALTRLAHDLPVIFPAHPRTRARLEEFGLIASMHRLVPGREKTRPARGRVCWLDALPYVDCVRLLGAARVVLTDSGGVQEETTCLGVPCITLRETTERPITVRAGTNVVAGVAPGSVLQHAHRVLAGGARTPMAPALWDGRAAERIADVLIDRV
jgi:UDP-N-acetylglucosamine 2-epimerase (non-hydrolysing)